MNNEYEKFNEEELKEMYITAKIENKELLEKELVKRGFSDFIERRKEKQKNIQKYREEIVNKKEENKKNILQYFFYFLLFLGIYIFNYYINNPKVSGYDNNPINYILQPIQIDIKENEINNIEILKIEKINNKKYVDIQFIPKAYYKTAARIASKKKYNDYGSGIIKYDFALVWGKYADKEEMKKVKYTQGNRWYFFRVNLNTDTRVEDISANSANTHVIASSENIKKAFEKLKKNDIIELEGYLVNIKWKNNKNYDFYWNTSLSRNDTGAGACEVMYVNKVKIGNKIYK